MFTNSNIQSKGSSESSNVPKVASKPVVNEAMKARVNSNFKCFNCQEVGHKSSECPKPRKKAMLVELEKEDVEEDDFVTVEEDTQDVASGEEGINLMLRRSCMTPKEEE